MLSSCFNIAMLSYLDTKQKKYQRIPLTVDKHAMTVILLLYI